MTPPTHDTDMARDDTGVHVALTHRALDTASITARVRSPAAGAVVTFAGTTRDTVGGRRVVELRYSAYVPLALDSMVRLARAVRARYGLVGIALVHRLGVVPVGEESVLVAVAAVHRGEAWRAGEEALEGCKERVEVWKFEEVEGGGGGWRDNREGGRG